MAKTQFEKIEPTQITEIGTNTKIEEMSTEMRKICVELSIPVTDFNPFIALSKIESYIHKYDRLLYSDISHYIFAAQEQERMCFDTNLISLLNFILNDEFQANPTVQDVKEMQKVIFKLYDHINLAEKQYEELKETDESYNKHFIKSIEPFKQEVTKEMSNQLITLVGIFTAIAFVVFGGISSLDNIFQGGMSDIPLLRLMILGVIWALAMLNLVYVFLVCIEKMTKLSIKSSNGSQDNLVQEYPIIFWSNYLLLSLLAILSWIIFLKKRNLLNWFMNIADKFSMAVSLIGFAIIFIVIILGAIALIKLRKRK